MSKRPKKRNSKRRKSKKIVRKKRKSKKIVKKKSKSKKISKNRKSLKTSQETIFKTKSDWIKKSLANKKQYEKKYNYSVKQNEDFWKKEGKRITWIKPYNKIKDVKYSKTDVQIKWFYDGTLNASANCIDRHLKKIKIKLQ